MKKNISIIYLLISSILLSSTAAIANSCLNPPDHNCTFYRYCLEVHTPCGPQGYALGYGERYCYKFLEIDPLLTEAGQAFSESTRNCLQKSLIPFIILNPKNENPSFNQQCSTIEDSAYDSHPICYTNHQNSICHLRSLQDLKLIFDQYESPDLMTAKSISQMKKIIQICLQQISSNYRSSGNSVKALQNSDSIYKFWLKKENEF